jgi:hypothetical protein
LAEPRDETRVQPILKLLADADRELSLAGERAQRIHHLLEICLDAADDLVTIAIVVNLANMVQRRVGLVAVAGAQLKEQCVADRGMRRQSEPS